MGRAVRKANDDDGVQALRDVLCAVCGRRRRSARREARIRRRRFVALVVLVLVTAAAMLLARGALGAEAAPTPGAGAMLAAVAGDGVGDILVGPSQSIDVSTVRNGLSLPALRFSNGIATVWSSLVGTALVSESDVSLSDMSLLGGVVTADDVDLVATADAGPATADAGVGECYVNGLAVNGKPLADSGAPVVIPGIGTLTVLDTTIDAGAPAPSAVVTGLTLTLDQAVGDLPAGSVIVVGRAAASSRRGHREAARATRRRARWPDAAARADRERGAAPPQDLVRRRRQLIIGRRRQRCVIVGERQLGGHGFADEHRRQRRRQLDARPGGAAQSDPRPVPRRGVSREGAGELHGHLRRVSGRHAQPPS